MMTGLTPVTLQAFQSQLAQAASSLGASPAASVLMDTIQGLPGWVREKDLRPSTLEQIAQAPYAGLCWLDPSLGASVCKLLGVNPPDSYDRQLRSDRPLQNPQAPYRWIDWVDQGFMVQDIGAFMMVHGVDDLSGVFHVMSQRLYVGLTDLGHANIAWEAARIDERPAYTRMLFHFQPDPRGLVTASWLKPYDDEAVSARKNIERLLGDFFNGVPVQLLGFRPSKQEPSVPA